MRNPLSLVNLNELMIGKVHGHMEIIKLIEGRPHIADKEKKKFVWTPTVMENKRLNRFRPITVIELVRIINNQH